MLSKINFSLTSITIQINENELRKRFSQKGEITDIQLNKEKKTAFIGYKAADQANEAVNFFHKTFIYSCRISVKLGKGFIQKNESKQLPSEKPDEDIQNKTPKKKFDPFEELKNDPEFESFLKVQRNIGLFLAIFTSFAKLYLCFI